MWAVIGWHLPVGAIIRIHNRLIAARQLGTSRHQSVISPPQENYIGVVFHICGQRGG